MAIVLGVLAAVVLIVVIAVLVVGFVLKLLWWALIGVILGVLARVILPGKQSLGLLATAGSGIAAALLGGLIAHALGVGSFLQLVIAAIVAVLIVGAVSAYESVTA